MGTNFFCSLSLPSFHFYDWGSKATASASNTELQGTFLEHLFVHRKIIYSMNISKRQNSKGDKITFYYDYGRGSGQRPSTGVFIYKKNHQW
jgi:hypothetical protein